MHTAVHRFNPSATLARPARGADTAAALARLEDRYGDPRRADCAARDKVEERSLTGAMLGLCAGWFVAGPLGALAGLACGVLVAAR